MRPTSIDHTNFFPPTETNNPTGKVSEDWYSSLLPLPPPLAGYNRDFLLFPGAPDTEADYFANFVCWDQVTCWFLLRTRASVVLTNTWVSSHWHLTVQNCALKILPQTLTHEDNEECLIWFRKWPFFKLGHSLGCIFWGNTPRDTPISQAQPRPHVPLCRRDFFLKVCWPGGRGTGHSAGGWRGPELPRAAAPCHVHRDVQERLAQPSHPGAEVAQWSRQAPNWLD